MLKDGLAVFTAGWCRRSRTFADEWKAVPMLARTADRQPPTTIGKELAVLLIGSSDRCTEAVLLL